MWQVSIPEGDVEVCDLYIFTGWNMYVEVGIYTCVPVWELAGYLYDLQDL